MECTLRNRQSAWVLRYSRASWLVAGLVLASAALAQDLDLGQLGDRGFRIEGVDADDRSGTSVRGAGDVNGDGLADVIIGAERADPGGDSAAGESYVVFGRAAPFALDLSNLGSGGFRIDGIDANDGAGTAVSGAGDVNGDGLSDVIVGSPGGSPGARSAAGQAYVVFGKSSTSPVDLAALGTGGFRIDGAMAGDLTGHSVAGAGDVNGDGLADVVVGAPGSNGGVGRAYVVFGTAETSPIDLASLGAGGFVIGGVDAFDVAGAGVSGAGDVDGDGLGDVIIGAYGADPGGDATAGESFVVFGKSGSAAVDLSNLGESGFRIDGANANDQSGRSVSGAGDVNGDGRADVVVGALNAAPGGDSSAGSSYVVFGRPGGGVVDLAQLGLGGLRIDGIDAFDLSGHSVSGAGDLNGDGLADIVIGALGGDPRGDLGAGESYVVFGMTGAGTIDLATLGMGGFRVDGARLDDNSGFSVSGAGDVNGDGAADLVVGAPAASPRNVGSAGASYVVFSRSAPLSSASYRTRSANGDPSRRAVGNSGNGSNESTPDARAWVDFSDGADPQHRASIETITLNRSLPAIASPGASVWWRLQTTRQAWTTVEVQFRYLDAELIAAEAHLQVAYSPDGQFPATFLPSSVDAARNTITATATRAGYFFLVERPIFADQFESP